MAAPCLFTIAQLSFIRREYLSHRLPPREVARSTNEKFGTAFTTRQISSLVATRGWTKRKKIARAKAVDGMDTAVLAAGHQRAELASVRDVIDGHARVGQLITAKAEKFATTAETAKTLSSAASAARAGISIVRQALGLDGPGGSITVNAGFDPGFSRSDASPFSEAGRERARIAAMKKTEPVANEEIEGEKAPT